MICAECLNGSDHLARCAGDNCRAGICPLCFEGDGLCSECRAEEAKGIWCPPARLPLCTQTGDPADECGHVDIDEVQP